MGNEKDIAEKTLQSFPDVFADIVNGLVFEGKAVIKEGDLEQSRARSSYTGEKGLRDQERDEVKFWKKEQIRIALIGLENETKEDADMPIRVIGYDGSSYRDQLYQIKDKNGNYRRNTNQRFPIVTLVLYFGCEKPWEAPKTLYENLGKIDKELKPYVNDYKMNLYEIAWLTDEQVKRFKSDFRFVADFFVQKRKNGKYIPSSEQIQHVKEFLDLMKYLTRDNRYQQIYQESQKEGKEINTMCDVLDEAERRGIEKERQNTEEAKKKADEAEKKADEAEKKAEEAQDSVRSLLGTLVELCKKDNLTKEETKDRLRDMYKIKETDQAAYFEEIWNSHN